MESMDKNDPEVIKYVITGETEEEITDQLNKLEIDLIRKFGQQPENAQEVMAFVASLRTTVFARLKGHLKVCHSSEKIDNKDQAN